MTQQDMTEQGMTARDHGPIDYLAVAPTVVNVVRDLDLGVTFDDLLCPAAPAKPELFAELSELLGLGGSADRLVASLAKDP